MTRGVSHVGIAVRDVGAALDLYERVLGLETVRRVRSADMGVEVGFLGAGNTELELIEPTGEDSALARFLERRGPGLHHVCLETDDLEAELARLESLGADLIDRSPRVPDVESPYSAYAWMHHRALDGLLVELVQHAR